MLEKILANKLVEEEQINKRLQKLNQKLSDAISSVKPSLSTPRPLNDVLELPKKQIKYPYINNICEFYRKTLFGDLTVKISIIYEEGNAYWKVFKIKNSLFKDSMEELEFNSFNQALTQFNKWKK